jgi:hypothetical protein
MNSNSNFIFEKCMEIIKLSQEFLEKIKQGIDKNQDMGCIRFFNNKG